MADIAERTREVLRLRYEMNLSPGEVARQLGLHPSTVSRILKRAESQRLVEHRITPPEYPELDSRQVKKLAGDLKDAYGLREAVLANVPESWCGRAYRWFNPSLDVALHRKLSQEAASLFLDTVRSHSVVAVGGGRAVHSLIQNLLRQRTLVADRLVVLSLQGGNGLYIYPDEQPAIVSANAAAVLLARSVSTAEVIQQVGLGYKRQNDPVAEARVFSFHPDDRGRVWPDLAVVGVGTIARGFPHCFECFQGELDDTSRYLATQLELKVEVVRQHLDDQRPRPKGAFYFPVGDLLARPFVIDPPEQVKDKLKNLMCDGQKADGQRPVLEVLRDLAEKIAKNVVAPQPEELSRIENVMVLAGGARKAFPLYHVLMRYLDTRRNRDRHSLVTDAWTGADLLALAQGRGAIS